MGQLVGYFLNHVLKIFSFTFTNKMNLQEDSAPSQLSNGTLLSLIRPPQVKLQLAKKNLQCFVGWTEAVVSTVV